MQVRTQIDEVLDHLYDAATDMKKWRVFLESFTRLMNADHAQILYGERNKARLTFTINYGWEHMPPGEHERLLEHYNNELLREDPRVVAFLKGAMPPRLPFTPEQIVDRDEFRASRVYKELLVPTGVEHMIQFAFADDDGTASALNASRGPDGQPFNQADRDLFGEIAPHVRRALTLFKRFAVLDFERHAALEALDHIPTGLVLADGDGRIRHLNQAAREIAADGDGLVCRHDVLSAGRPDERAALLLAVRAAIDAATQGEVLPGEALTLTRRGGRAALHVLVSTLWGNHLRFGLGRLDEPVAVLFVTDPDRPRGTPAELLRHLFGLTPTEAVLVEALVAEETLDRAAAAAGITKNTARQHLKSIFAKVGVHSQTQLVKRVLATPVWMQAGRQHPALFPKPQG